MQHYSPCWTKKINWHWYFYIYFKFFWRRNQNGHEIFIYLVTRWKEIISVRLENSQNHINPSAFADTWFLPRLTHLRSQLRSGLGTVQYHVLLYTLKTRILFTVRLREAVQKKNRIFHDIVQISFDTYGKPPKKK